MRIGDLLGSAVGGLWRQKARTALTLTGVAVGGCALAFSLSLGIGLRALIDHEFQSRPGFWQVYVHPARTGPQVAESEVPPEKLAVPGEMSPDRARRLRAQKLKQYRQSQPSRPPIPLTEDRLAELAAGHPDVTGYYTIHGSPGTLRLDAVTRDAYVTAARPDPATAKRLVAGRLPASDSADECLVSEILLYDLGVTDEADVSGQLGKPVRVLVGGTNNAKHLGLARVLGVNTRDLTPGQEAVLERVTAELPAAIDKLDLGPAEKALLKALLAGRRAKDDPLPPWLSEANAGAEFRIVGVVRPLTEEEEKAANDEPFGWSSAHAGVLLPRESGNRLFNRLPWVKETGYETATLVVRPGGDLKGVADHVEAKGFAQHSGARWYNSVKREVTLIAAGLNLFALVSLFVAATGITNTLVTSVVERTREIGVLKALGATDRQVMLLFLTEGSVIGLLGGLLGLGLAWALSIPGDGFVRKLIQDQSPEKLVSDTVFEFPAWLIASTVLFAAAVTTLAALYPARRAARVQPVEALRYE